MQLDGVPLFWDQPDPANTAFAIGDDGVLVMSSSAAHNAWSAREGALMLYASMPAKPWAAAVRVRMSEGAHEVVCGLTVYSGPDNAAIPLHLGITKWGSVCSSGYSARYQTTAAGADVVSGGYPFSAVDCGLVDADAQGGWTWFRLSGRANGTTFDAEWSDENSTEQPASGWTLLKTFSMSSSPDRVGLLHATGTAAASNCSFKDFALAPSAPPPSPPPAPPPPPRPPSPPPPPPSPTPPPPPPSPSPPPPSVG